MKKLVVLLLLLQITLCASAQKLMRDVLCEMPDTIVPYLSRNNRLDMIDFFDSGMKAVVSNSLDGKSSLLKLNDRYASLQLTSASQLDMRILDTKEMVDSASQIVCVVCTYGTGIRQSTVSFYSLQWRPLPTNLFLQWSGLVYYATLGESDDTFILTPECRLNPPANETQEDEVKTSIFLNWNGINFKQS